MKAGPAQVPGTEVPVRIGVSACLLGQEVRFDGGHKHDRFLTETLGTYIEWVPVCPEAELGLGTPREAIRLQEIDGETRLVGRKSGADHTAPMRAYAHDRAEALARQEIFGYILKKDSPSCGMERVRLHGAAGPPRRVGRGLFAEALIARLPNLPVEEEGRLCDPRLRENWVERIFAYRRLRDLWLKRWTIGDLVAFHTAHKLALMAHTPSAYQSLGRLVARARSLPREPLRSQYETEFMAALAKPATPGRQANVLLHITGYFKKQLDGASKRELLGAIEDYRQGLVPLVVPLTLVAHYVRLFDIAYLKGQTYLHPHPKELALRNHV